MLNQPLPAVPFYMYEGRALDHGWLRHCAAFDDLRSTAYNERLAEVYIRDSLAEHPWRTYIAEQAWLIVVPLWEVVSFNVGICNGTSHRQRMANAAAALHRSPLMNRRSQHHFFVSSGCIESGMRLRDRLGSNLARQMTAFIVGRDRAYSPFHGASAVGRCTLEIPYVQNPHVDRDRRRSSAHSIVGNSSREDRGGRLRVAVNVGTGAGGVGRRRRWLLAFMGTLDVCCEPGRAIRLAVRKLVGYAPNDTQVLHFARAPGRPIAGGSAAAERAHYVAAGEQLAMASFCLVPAGDNEVSSRLYSAMAAGCLPVVIANQLSGAFASHVPYDRFWLRVEQHAFLSAPTDLIAKLREMPSSEVAKRRAVMQRYVADVTYPQRPPTSVDSSQHQQHTPAGQFGSRSAQSPTSRLASNLLRAADEGCLRGLSTASVGIYARRHPYANDDKWGLNCSCLREPPIFFWGPMLRHKRESGTAGAAAATAFIRAKLWTRGRVPTEVCRCLHCATLCPTDDETDAVLAEQERKLALICARGGRLTAEQQTALCPGEKSHRVLQS